MHVEKVTSPITALHSSHIQYCSVCYVRWNMATTALVSTPTSGDDGTCDVGVIASSAVSVESDSQLMSTDDAANALLSMGPILPANPEDTTCYWYAYVSQYLFLIWLCVMGTRMVLLWLPYGIGQTIIFLPCGCFLLLSSFFPRLVSAVADWMSAILRHMVWP